MKKRIVSLVVVVCIMLGFTIPAEAAYAKSPQNRWQIFCTQKTYSKVPE